MRSMSDVPTEKIYKDIGSVESCYDVKTILHISNSITISCMCLMVTVPVTDKHNAIIGHGQDKSFKSIIETK